MCNPVARNTLRRLFISIARTVCRHDIVLIWLVFIENCVYVYSGFTD